MENVKDIAPPKPQEAKALSPMESLVSGLENDVETSKADGQQETTRDFIDAIENDDVGKLKDNTIIECAPGEKGDWNEKLNQPLQPNTKYKIRDTVYETDNNGRVAKVSGKLELDMNSSERPRNEYQQHKSVDIKDGQTDSQGRKTDDGGHIIAHRFNGAGEQINYLPMKSDLNRGAWKAMENRWEKYLSDGKEVEVEIIPKYDGVSKRPSKFIVTETINGLKSDPTMFNNN